jgi:Concanavalin A-like lectin/glucanases superfamily
MKKLYLLIILLLLTNGCNNDNTTNPPTHDYSSLSIGLLAYYPFDGNVRDISGNYLDGYIRNNCYYVNGVLGKALYVVGQDSAFSSSGGYVVIPPIDTTGLNALSICIWVKEDTLYIPKVGGEAYIMFGIDGAAWCGIVHFYGDIEFAAGAVGDLTSPGAINPILVPFDSSDTYKWVFYSLVYNNGSLSAYRNGLLLKSIKQKLMIYNNPGYIAHHEWNGPYAGSSTRFSGAFDELRIYKRALTDQEIQELYQLK